jgi:hypothetical protein
MNKSISKLWIMHTYSYEKEHLKVMIIEHFKVYDLYMNTVCMKRESKV